MYFVFLLTSLFYYEKMYLSIKKKKILISENYSKRAKIFLKNFNKTQV